MNTIIAIVVFLCILALLGSVIFELAVHVMQYLNEEETK